MGLEVRDLCVERGGVPVLMGVSFDLPPGKALILRGPNGAGKTTLLRTLAGLQPALSGAVTGGEDLIAYASHSDGLKAMLTVSENLAFWADVFGQRDVTTALHAFSLEPLRDRLAGTLSAGQKRRLGLARMLVTGRPVWMLDEPTVSLDKDAVRQFATVVAGHLASGGSALIATHIDLGLEAEVLDISPLRAQPDARAGASDEAFL
ncbi:heme ABC exporter ATP-binding protein CcmA [Roseobacter sp. YSTF-M11]|uniref:Heme ABC exporter ATP-binding protein CcmA n=1 Tax=Roseobacter insulae TaxID=2859783 RepID=A0A9X1FVH3_9RHOB|nr:heme ABC exporter ATP-binding protein CcmA [Roseobacter insulae]MBW4708486.1 heme ABC exporter ATP-binding protein CcmA [Roseobacter insulae]